MQCIKHYLSESDEEAYSLIIDDEINRHFIKFKVKKLESRELAIGLRSLADNLDKLDGP